MSNFQHENIECNRLRLKKELPERIGEKKKSRFIPRHRYSIIGGDRDNRHHGNLWISSYAMKILTIAIYVTVYSCTGKALLKLDLIVVFSNKIVRDNYSTYWTLEHIKSDNLRACSGRNHGTQPKENMLGAFYYLVMAGQPLITVISVTLF